MLQVRVPEAVPQPEPGQIEGDRGQNAEKQHSTNSLTHGRLYTCMGKL